MNIGDWCIPSLNVSNKSRQQMGKESGEKREVSYNLYFPSIENKEKEIKER
jgi:hypothetical protein